VGFGASSRDDTEDLFPFEIMPRVNHEEYDAGCDTSERIPSLLLREWILISQGVLICEYQSSSFKANSVL